MFKIAEIEIVGDYKHIEVREIDTETGQIRRYVVSPGHDVSDLPDEVKQVAAENHTPEVIAAYQAATSEPA